MTDGIKEDNGHPSIKRFKIYLSEKLQDKEAVIVSDYYAFGTSQHFFDTGIIGIIQEITHGLLPIYIALDIVQFSHIKEKLDAKGVPVFIIFEDKSNLKHDTSKDKILFNFDWQHENVYDCVSVSNYTIGDKVD
ncbi:hypothetical protein [Cysteiniphilum sp. 6C5]|uniref:hypothetical protein n=1 Tax=unclassified Cysteiniphilum TaxID=2610889 RepID=UPI003F87C66B